jgi:hypothetical protein
VLVVLEREGWGRCEAGREEGEGLGGGAEEEEEEDEERGEEEEEGEREEDGAPLAVGGGGDGHGSLIACCRLRCGGVVRAGSGLAT